MRSGSAALFDLPDRFEKLGKSLVEISGVGLTRLGRRPGHGAQPRAETTEIVNHLCARGVVLPPGPRAEQGLTDVRRYRPPRRVRLIDHALQLVRCEANVRLDRASLSVKNGHAAEPPCLRRCHPLLRYFVTARFVLPHVAVGRPTMPPGVPQASGPCGEA